MKSREWVRTLGALGAGAVALLASSTAQAQITLPWTEGVEGTAATTWTESVPSIAGAADFSFTTGVLNGQVGPVDNSIAAGSMYTYFQGGLRFDVTNTVVIETVYVYPPSAGDVVVNLVDSNNVVLDTATVAVAGGSVKTAIPLEFVVTPGTNYMLNADGTTIGSMYRNTGGATYPYVHGDLQITGVHNSQNT